MVVRRVKIQKRRGVLIALRAIVISSVAEKSLWQYGNQHVCEISSTTLLFCIFLLSHTDFLPMYKKDPSASLGMTMSENPSHQSLVTPNPQLLITAFKLSPWGVPPLDCVRKRGERVLKVQKVHRFFIFRGAQILRLSSHIPDQPFSNIRLFSPLRMTKCAAPLPLNLMLLS